MESYYGGPIGIQQCSFEWYHPDPCGLPFPKIGVRNPDPKPQSLLSQEWVKLRTSNLAGIFTESVWKKSAKNFGEKAAWAYGGTAQNFFSTPYYLRNGKATNFNFGRYIQRVHLNKSPLKILEKRSVGVFRDCPYFWGTPNHLWNGLSYELQILYAHS